MKQIGIFVILSPSVQPPDTEQQLKRGINIKIRAAVADERTKPKSLKTDVAAAYHLSSWFSWCVPPCFPYILIWLLKKNSIHLLRRIPLAKNWFDRSGRPERNFQIRSSNLKKHDLNSRSDTLDRTLFVAIVKRDVHMIRTKKKLNKKFVHPWKATSFWHSRLACHGVVIGFFMVFFILRAVF